MKEKLHILHLPKWYPNPEDPQLGIFIKKQILAVSAYYTQSVLYIKSIENLKEKYVIEKKMVGEVLEICIFYNKPISRAKQFVFLNKLYSIGIKRIKQEVGKPDILHVHNLITPAIWANKYSKKHNIPWVLSEHWSGYTAQSGVFNAKMKWEKNLWHWYSEKASCTISVSKFLQKALKENKIGEKHFIIPNVVEGEYNKEERNDDEIRLLNVSDMVDKVKNISGLIKSFSGLVSKYPNAHLWIVGGGPDLEKLKDLSSNLNLDDNVKFFGRLENSEVIDLYKQIDFVVINSRVETFSVVAAESIRAGKPVLSTRCGGVEEFVDERHGILVNSEDEDELNSALDRMVNNYSDYDPEFLSKYAKDKFSSKKVGKSLANLYQSIIS